MGGLGLSYLKHVACGVSVVFFVKSTKGVKFDVVSNMDANHAIWLGIGVV